LDGVRRCRLALDSIADLTQYTTTTFVDDIDAVRRALGYSQINLSAVSYGSRAAFTYASRYPKRVRAISVLGPAPWSFKIPLTFAANAQHSLDQVLTACESDTACARAHPGVRAGVAALFARLDSGNVRAHVKRASDSSGVDVRLSREVVAEALRYMLYFPAGARLVPQYLARAQAGDLEPLGSLALALRQDLGSEGLYLSITCTEDLPFVSQERGRALARGTFLGDYRLREQLAACAEWPRGKVPREAGRVVRTPMLIVTGDRDPATPRQIGDSLARAFPRARHIVVPGGGHMLIGLPDIECITSLQVAFFERPGQPLRRATCVSTIRPAPFATSPEG
jgi:pimeloyl-ACP methyl ester carboxylesterase